MDTMTDTPVRRSPRSLRREDGQVLVEAAIVLPAMTFLILCTLQVTMVQHARVMTEYAVFSAARAGAVFNADPLVMRKAGELALLPTMGRTDDFPTFITTWGMSQVEATLRRALTGARPVSVRILNPTPGSFNTTNSRHLNGEEIDFDDIRTATSRANLLSIELRYLYKMTIPFANRMVLAILFAAQGRTLDAWRGYDMTAQTIGTVTGPDAQQVALLSAPSESQLRYASALMRGALARQYLFPITATYTIRMQSNPYRDKVALGQDWQ